MAANAHDITAGGDIPKWTLADRLMKARRNAGLEQPELAETIGIARSSLSAYENGHRVPRRPVLLSWALATGVPLEWLLEGFGPTSDQEIPWNRCTRPFQQSLWDSEPETGRAPNHSGVHAYAA